jgi:hypothetical protein
MREALRLAVTARKRGKPYALSNPKAFEQTFCGRMDQVPDNVLWLARQLVDTKISRLSELEGLIC